MKKIDEFGRCIFIIVAVISPLTLSARILCVFQMPAVSHQATFKPISRTLSLRGHEVIAVTPHPINDPALINLTEIDTSRSTYEIISKHGFEFFMSKELTVQSKIRKIFAMYNEFAEAILGNQQFREIYTDQNQKFDLIIAQIYVSPIMFGLSEKLKAPVIGVSSMGGWSGTHVAAGNHNPPSLYSEMFLHYNGDLTFVERIKSTLYYIWSRLYVYFIAMPKWDAIMRKYLGQDLPYLADIERNDIATELESPQNGVVYFSLGSNVKSVNIPEKIRSLLMKAFAELPYKVLWKFENEELLGKPKNVVIRKWLPQQDILAHPNVKVFISQCGLQSTEEAIDREIPMVGIPFIADQEMNSKRLAAWGVLRHIDYLNTTKEELVETIIDVAENPSYREKMQGLRRLMQDEPWTGIQKAVWWAEYVIRHKGTKHLKSPTVDIEWYKYLLFDVFAVLIGAPIAVLIIIIKLARNTTGKTKNKSKTQ
ncbi:UDP-glycosyltransferase UGT5 isoform X2 [Dendroctonus ponderosae]|uniref:UDP-glycosyltransferase UGT5 isoform X2 n=1 Tax=Dendroctonus ponderosae TaxID=77166 RepID=UPI002034F233|nr:UDP-glycosyltransferase UGT5 isoform X2 [Dendroctonus ponderosae]